MKLTKIIMAFSSVIIITIVPVAAGTVQAAVTPELMQDYSKIVSKKESKEYLAAHSSKSKDMRGWLPSLYKGKYYREWQESYRKCVANREASFTYMLRGKGSQDTYAWFGTYQMTPELLEGVSWMMAAESRKTKDGLRWEARSLINKKGNQWSRYWQDRAFYTILNYSSDWSGIHHWSVQRNYCL